MRAHRATPESVVGVRFGRFVVTDLVFREGRSYCVCRCDCGNIKDVRAARLKSGKSTSCGCFRTQRIKETKLIHGHSRTPTYGVWKSMKSRCCDINNKRYGGRGIRVCDRWQSFEAFFEDMGERPSADHSIDRINNDGDYEPGNCRWAIESVQKRNTSRNRLLTVNGQTLAIVDWAKRVGISAPAIVGRLNRGWPLEKALTTTRLKK